MRVGQKNKLTYRWARKGSRPRAAHDQRTQSTYLFGAVCPERGAGAALVLPACNTEAMQLHLDEIATKVTPGAHAILILDQAGWHGAERPQGSKQYLAPAAAAALARTQPPRKHLAVHASELAVQPHLQILRRHRRSLLLRLEHPYRSALENHVHRPPRLGTSSVGIGATHTLSHCPASEFDGASRGGGARGADRACRSHGIPRTRHVPECRRQDPLKGYLFKPATAAAGRLPAVVMMHGRAGAYSTLAKGVL